ncbi:MAG: hypothetical protein JWQ20_2836 [Conexibacter sp.]|nr:hypothetical protein [Conexibacter sp.]
MARVRVTVCRVPGYNRGGGYYGGHISAEWHDGNAAIQITAHGYANRPRVLALLASIVSHGNP